MGEYALLVAPSANRVYAAEAPRLLAAELGAVLEALDVGSPRVRLERIAGVDYLLIAGDDGAALAAACAVSSAPYALFERVGDLFRGIELPVRARYPEDLVSIPKYTGKTNEQFTALLLNVTLAASARPRLLLGGRGSVLDPVCGRGTTLSLATLRGYDAYGVDVDAKDVEAYSTFLKTWARTHRVVHTHRFAPVRRNKKTVAERLDVELFADRAAQKAGDAARISVIVADTTEAPRHFRPASIDAIVADLPYGVAHGSHRGHDLHRRADELLERALPAWASMLRPGAALGLSFNTRTLRRDDAERLCRDAGLRLAEYGEIFAHRVDSSIRRDLIVAVRDN